jgi:hypothetical protein
MQVKRSADEELIGVPASMTAITLEERFGG